MTEIKRCTRCIMDNASDPTITFDEQGNCNYCTDAINESGNVYFPNEEGEKRLQKLLMQIKKTAKGEKYDCIMGLSGGLDSSYLAYWVYKNWRLRILAVHIDDGYDTDISKSNLKNLIAATGFDYEVIRPDPVQFNALTLAFMRAGVPNIAIPQDNVLFAFLYKRMKENNIKYFLSGGNFALECILQRGNSYKTSDVVNISDINKKFGTQPINKLEFISTIQKKFNEKLLGIKTPQPLDYIDYNRARAFKELQDFCGFEYYGRKHLESILTAFTQLYWFPKKFGVDKRTSHLSSMIVSGQITREEALREYSEPLYNEKQLNEYIDFVKEHMEISDSELEKIMEAPIHMHEEYRVEDSRILYRLLRGIHNLA